MERRGGNTSARGPAWQGHELPTLQISPSPIFDSDTEDERLYNKLTDDSAQRNPRDDPVLLAVHDFGIYVVISSDSEPHQRHFQLRFIALTQLDSSLRDHGTKALKPDDYPTIQLSSLPHLLAVSADGHQVALMYPHEDGKHQLDVHRLSDVRARISKPALSTRLQHDVHLARWSKIGKPCLMLAGYMSITFLLDGSRLSEPRVLKAQLGSTDWSPDRDGIIAVSYLGPAISPPPTSQFDPFFAEEGELVLEHAFSGDAISNLPCRIQDINELSADGENAPGDRLADQQNIVHLAWLSSDLLVGMSRRGDFGFLRVRTAPADGFTPSGLPQLPCPDPGSRFFAALLEANEPVRSPIQYIFLATSMDFRVITGDLTKALDRSVSVTSRGGQPRARPLEPAGTEDGLSLTLLKPPVGYPAEQRCCGLGILTGKSGLSTNPLDPMHHRPILLAMGAGSHIFPFGLQDGSDLHAERTLMHDAAALPSISSPQSSALTSTQTSLPRPSQGPALAIPNPPLSFDNDAKPSFRFSTRPPFEARPPLPSGEKSQVTGQRVSPKPPASKTLPSPFQSTSNARASSRPASPNLSSTPPAQSSSPTSISGFGSFVSSSGPFTSFTISKGTSASVSTSTSVPTATPSFATAAGPQDKTPQIATGRIGAAREAKSSSSAFGFCLNSEGEALPGTPTFPSAATRPETTAAQQALPSDSEDEEGEKEATPKPASVPTERDADEDGWITVDMPGSEVREDGNGDEGAKLFADRIRSLPSGLPMGKGRSGGKDAALRPSSGRQEGTDVLKQLVDIAEYRAHAGDSDIAENLAAIKTGQQSEAIMELQGLAAHLWDMLTLFEEEIVCLEERARRLIGRQTITGRRLREVELIVEQEESRRSGDSQEGGLQAGLIDAFAAVSKQGLAKDLEDVALKIGTLMARTNKGPEQTLYPRRGDAMPWERTSPTMGRSRGYRRDLRETYGRVKASEGGVKAWVESQAYKRLREDVYREFRHVARLRDGLWQRSGEDPLQGMLLDRRRAEADRYARLRGPEDSSALGLSRNRACLEARNVAAAIVRIKDIRNEDQGNAFEIEVEDAGGAEHARIMKLEDLRQKRDAWIEENKKRILQVPSKVISTAPGAKSQVKAEIRPSASDSTARQQIEQPQDPTRFPRQAAVGKLPAWAQSDTAVDSKAQSTLSSGGQPTPTISFNSQNLQLPGRKDTPSISSLGGLQARETTPTSAQLGAPSPTADASVHATAERKALSTAAPLPPMPSKAPSVFNPSSLSKGLGAAKPLGQDASLTGSLAQKHSGSGMTGSSPPLREKTSEIKPLSAPPDPASSGPETAAFPPLASKAPRTAVIAAASSVPLKASDKASVPTPSPATAKPPAAPIPPMPTKAPSQESPFSFSGISSGLGSRPMSTSGTSKGSRAQEEVKPVGVSLFKPNAADSPMPAPTFGRTDLTSPATSTPFVSLFGSLTSSTPATSAISNITNADTQPTAALTPTSSVFGTSSISTAPAPKLGGLTLAPTQPITVKPTPSLFASPTSQQLPSQQPQLQPSPFATTPAQFGVSGQATAFGLGANPMQSQQATAGPGDMVGGSGAGVPSGVDAMRQFYQTYEASKAGNAEELYKKYASQGKIGEMWHKMFTKYNIPENERRRYYPEYQGQAPLLGQHPKQSPLSTTSTAQFGRAGSGLGTGMSFGGSPAQQSSGFSTFAGKPSPFGNPFQSSSSSSPFGQAAQSGFQSTPSAGFSGGFGMQGQSTAGGFGQPQTTSVFGGSKNVFGQRS